MHAASVIMTLLTSATIVQAGELVIHDSRTDFDADAGPQSIESFESESLGDLTLPTTLDSGLGVAMPVGDVSAYIGAENPDGYGLINTTDQGRNYLAFGRNLLDADGSATPQTGSYSVEFTFGGLINAFGFDLSGTEFPSGAEGFNVTTFSGGQIIDDFFWSSDQLFGVRFYGLIANEAFDAIRINIPVIGLSGTADYAAFDEVAWAVPAPSATALLAMSGLLAARRRR